MYCSQTDIEADFKDITFDADSTVSNADLALFITSESNYIDSYISAKYVTPVIMANSPLAFELLKKICIFLVSDRVKSVLEIKTGNVGVDQKIKAQSSTRKPIADLDRIVDGKLRLIDCQIASSDDGLAFGITDSSYKPFSLNKQQW